MSSCHSTHIVVAEDDAASRALLVSQLRKAGYAVIGCENGKQALEAIRREVSCIVVADWMMPEMDGLELCRTIRGLAEMQALSFVYFILLTAHREKDQIVAGLEAGADDYLTKPYNKQELLARIRAGQRIHDLQTELISRQVELHKVNGELALLNQELERLANTDALTGLANRRYLFERLSEAWSLAERSDRPLSCIIFDVDKFKSVNDAHGHAVGDSVLQYIAQRGRRCLRRYDIFSRFGGEEFCVICPDTDINGAAALAERIRLAVAEPQCKVQDVVVPLAISLGVATRSDEHNEHGALLVAADEMLYRAKQNGRNQTWVYEPGGGAHRVETPIGAR